MTTANPTTTKTPTKPTTTNTPPRLALRPAEAAAALGISARTLWAMTASGQGPRVVRVGRRILYPVEEISAWLAEQAGPAHPGR